MKIATLLPGATEIVCDLGLEDSLVAVSHECDFPTTVKSLPKITSSILKDSLDPNQIDEEVIKAVHEGKSIYQVDGDMLNELQPDVIVTQGVCDVCAVNVGTVKETMKLLPDIVNDKIQTVSLTGKCFDGIIRDIQLVAKATQTEQRATEFIDNMQKRWQAIKMKTSENKPSVLMLEWPEPFFYGGHWVPEMVDTAGGIDCIGKVAHDSGRCTLEEVLVLDPDKIILCACGYDLEQNAKFAKKLLQDDNFKKLTAVKNNAIWAIDANSYCSRPAPRIVDGTEKLAAIFNHEAENVPGIEHIQIS